MNRKLFAMFSVVLGCTMNTKSKKTVFNPYFLFLAVAVFPLAVPNISGAVTNVEVQAIEITQAIQCLQQSIGYTDCADNSLELTTNRPIAIRVYLKHDGLSKPDPFEPIFDADVKVRWIATHQDTLPPYALPDEDSIVFKVPGGTDLSQLRNDTRGSANFVIPPYVIIPDPNNGTTKKMLLGSPNKNNLLWVQAEVKYQVQGVWKTAMKEIQLGGKDVSGNSLPGGLFARDPIRVGWRYVYYNPKPLTGYTPPKQNVVSWEVGIYNGFMDKIFPRPVEYTGSSPTIISYNYKNCQEIAKPCLPVGSGTNYWSLWQVVQQQYALEMANYTINPIDALIGWIPSVQGSPGFATGKAGWVMQLSEQKQSEQALAHELGHTTPVASAKDIGQDTGGQFDTLDCQSKILEAGFDVDGEMVLPGDDHRDFMSTAIGNWVSPFMWKQMLGQQCNCIANSATSTSLMNTFQILTEKEPTLISSITDPAILITGRVNLDDTAKLEHVFQIENNGSFNSSPGGAYCLDFKQSGVVLSSYCFDLFSANCPACKLMNEDVFVFTLPMPATADTIVLRHGSNTLASVTKSANPPNLSLTQPPDDPYDIKWTASDNDGDEVHYTVLYSTDGASWSPIAVDVPNPSLDMDPLPLAGQLAGSENAKFRILASDGFNTTSADTESVKITRKTPHAFIRVPMDGSFINYVNDFIILRGTGQDREDGVLSGASLTWKLDDEVIGSGSEVYLPPKSLPLGRHLITLTALDSDLNETSATVTANIGFPVRIDIKPGSYPNSIQLSNKGDIPVAILADASFSAPEQVINDSLTFGLTGNETSLDFCNRTPKDVNGDGYPDQICHFKTASTGLQCGNRQAILKGQSISGIPFQGTDSVRILSCP